MQLVNMWDQIMVQILAQCMTMITIPIFWLISLLLAVQCGLIEIKKQKQVVGKLPAFLFAIIERWVCIIISGILGGVIASTLFLLTGISLAYDTVLYLWVIMFLFFMPVKFCQLKELHQKVILFQIAQLFYVNFLYVEIFCSGLLFSVL